MEVCRSDLPKLDGLSGGTDYEDKEVEVIDLDTDKDGINVAMLESEVPNKDYAEYVIQPPRRM